MNQIETRTWWIYNGPGNGRGARHMVVSVGKDEVVTWSDPRIPSSSHTWLGTREEFLKQFKPEPTNS